ncbi:MAG: amylo-alpha-1,6-glucosidase [Bacteroidales bacterium]|nr:amylo-alpha-1,6-glucosidase [Bacteroidales bacterium]MCF8456496.1 amylo-alpha-1,6-glucosidase [Bacteroidales bacterium]
MSYLDIDKNHLINLEYSLHVELLRSNRAGSYANTTVIGSNTRKYHGLLVCPLPEIDNQNHVLLSNLDETVIQHGAEFRLGVHKYPGNVWEPKGHKYAMSFTMDPMPTIVYRVGGVLLKKEMILIQNEARILLRYTLLDAHSPTKIKLQPFLAYRSVHALSKENPYANTDVENIPNGIKSQMYNNYPWLYMQTSKKADFVALPDWYKNIEYIEEQRRGYEYSEDLFVPGHFEFDIEKGESIIFSAGVKQTTAKSLNEQFDKELTARTPRDSFHNNLKNAAQQFIVRSKEKVEIYAGFPWYGRRGRNTFIALPGLTLSVGDVKTCEEVLDTMSSELNGALFPNMGYGDYASYNSADAPLWYFWTIQQYADKTGNYANIKKKYWAKMKAILEGFKKCADFNIRMTENGLIWAGHEGVSVTWMDALIDGSPVTPRTGYAVEINALWYNAVQFAIVVAEKNKDKEFIEEWKDLPCKIEKSFINTFWKSERNYLADYVNDEITDWAVRPNQIFAASLPFSPLTKDMKKAVVDKVQKELLTKKGLRTLSPKNPNYKGTYEGDQASRNNAIHQGTVWPWLIGHFAEAYLKLHEKSGVDFIKKFYNGIEKEMSRHGIGTISEVFDGDPPNHPGGAISHAGSVAELLRVKELITIYSE